MKKILMMCFGLAMSTSIYSHVYYDKNLGFFNHYKEVSQTNMNNGDIFMECHDPGWTRCKPQALLVITFDGVSTEVTNDDFKNIDDMVTKAATDGNDAGKFIYGEKFFVSFTYNEDTDKLSTKIYTIAEATYYKLI